MPLTNQIPVTHRDAYLLNSSFSHLIQSLRVTGGQFVGRCHIRTSEVFRSVWQWVVSPPFRLTATDSDKTDASHIPALSCASLEGKQQRCQGRDRCSSMPMCRSWHIPHRIAADGEEQADNPLASVCMCAFCERVRAKACTQHPWSASVTFKRRHHL